MENLTGKIALITGAGGGIGRAIALKLADLGMKLAVCGRREGLLHQTAEMTGRPQDVLVLPGDLTQEAHLEKCIAAVKARFGGLDVLVNNAGQALNCPFESTTTADFDRLMTINARTPFILCRLALPLLKQSDCASVINIGSVVSHVAYADQSAYTASKHALLGLTRALAKEVRADGIRVHALCPGGVNTDLIRSVRPDLTGDGMISPEEIAEAAAFLLLMRGNGVIDEIQMHRIGKEPFLS